MDRNNSSDEKYEEIEPKSTSEANMAVSKDRSLTFDSAESTQQDSKSCIHYQKAAISSEVDMNQLKSTMTTEEEENKRIEHDTVILSPRTAGHSNVLSRRRNVGNEEAASVNTTQIAKKNNEFNPHFERRRIFNLLKHVISIVLIILDMSFDWVEYSEMNNRGNYSIVEGRRVKNIKFTVKCDEIGENVQLVFMIFTIVATILSLLQIVYIIYEMFLEYKGKIIYKQNLSEYVETFVFLFFFEITQIMLIMGFYDVCTLDCTVDFAEISVALSGLVSAFKISWRFFTSFKCCTVYWKRTAQEPRSRPTVTRPTHRDTDCCRFSDSMKSCLLIFVLPCLVLLIPFLPCILIYFIIKKCDCDCDVCNAQVGDQESIENRWKCEQSCKCCILRCFPSRFPEQDTEACDCTCKKCLSYEQICKCCILRCFPTKLPISKDDVFECKCGESFSTERNCRCCILRCCPTYLVPPQYEVCTCRCGDCIAFERHCKCFTFRCCPTHLNPSETDIWTCSCRKCLARIVPCKCFTFRCFPQFLIPPDPDICTCRCGDCLAFERPCKCFTFRCFPTHLNPSETDIWTCRCRECLAFTIPCKCFIYRCFPEYLTPSHPDICTCKCAECLSCSLPCKCFIARCFPEQQNPSESDWFQCKCGDCINCERNICCCILRLFPSYVGENDFCECFFRETLTCESSLGCCVCRFFPSLLDNPQNDLFECTCKKPPRENDRLPCTDSDMCVKRQKQPAPIIPPQLFPTPQPRIPTPSEIQPPISVITTQPLPKLQILIEQDVPLPLPSIPTRPLCIDFRKKCLQYLVVLFVILSVPLFLFYLFILVVQVQFVFHCPGNQWLVQAIQEVFVQNYMKLLNIL